MSAVCFRSVGLVHATRTADNAITVDHFTKQADILSCMVAALSGAITLKRNFQFDGFSVVRWGDRFIDLHNAYDLESFGTDLAGTKVDLSFTRNQYAIDPDKLPSKVTLSCMGNLRVAFNDLSEIAAPLDDEGIEIAYFDEGCDWLSFLDEDIARSQEPLGLHVSFINGFAVRIFCDEATLATQ